MNSLPSIYKKDGNLKKNNQDYCYAIKKENIEKRLDQLFESLGPVMDKKVQIQTMNSSFETYLIKRTQKELTTIDHKIIPIDSILSIKRIS